MKFTKIAFLSITILLSSYHQIYQTTDAYFFGLKSANNTITNIQDIQHIYGVYPQVVSYIFEGLPTTAAATIESLATRLGTGRVYHIGLSPQVTPDDINDGSYDKIYSNFFNLIKKHDLQVIFRTMHEMNGGWYHWSGDPIAFKKSWNRIWKLSRDAGLDQKNILFDFSVNHVDMPAVGNNPSQDATLITCTPNRRLQTGCLSFEDYRPGSGVVDVVGFSMYNRGKGGDDRVRLTPEQILYDKKRDFLDRLSSYNKPIIIDEVGTTSANYDGYYDRQTTKNSYLYDYDSKNKWLAQLKDLLDKEDRIKGAIYFNVDYTRGYKYELKGESDRAVLDVGMNKVYYGIYPLIGGSKLDKQELGFKTSSGVSHNGSSGGLYSKEYQTMNKYKRKRILKGPGSITITLNSTGAGVTSGLSQENITDLKQTTTGSSIDHTVGVISKEPTSIAVFDQVLPPEILNQLYQK